MPEAAGRRVCLAISSFRNDESVERLLSSASTPRARGCFERVIVVDSLGTGRIEALLRSRDWSHVTYESASTNLGSAGNLARRLVLAAQTGCDYVFALNHDGELDLDIVDKLVEFAEKTPRVGAVYPLRYLTQQRRYLVPSRTWIPLPFNGMGQPPVEEAVEVSWSSSNASLYALAPVRLGILPWADLWMGWEDLGYGRLLEQAGYSQHVLTTARCDDNYEYRTRRFLGVPLQLTEKPAWYAYYQARNLLLVTKRTRRSRAEYVTLAARLAQEALLSALVRPQKRQRIRLLAEGLRDGLMNRTGKGRLPA